MADVEVWSVRLDVPGEVRRRLAEALSADEWERARRLRRDDDRQRFVTCRGLLRMIIGGYVDREPARLQFSYGPAGKPALAGESRVEFNLARSGGFALVACTRGRRVGVDLELVREVADLERVARRYFSARERVTLTHLPAAERTWAFYTCWTRKEAYLKATGDGLSRPLDGFAVAFGPGAAPALTWVGNSPREVSRWRMEAVELGSAAVGAVVAEAGGWRLRTRLIEELGSHLAAPAVSA
jgi:4'-phosphopantetheinyl transferase